MRACQLQLPGRRRRGLGIGRAGGATTSTLGASGNAARARPLGKKATCMSRQRPHARDRRAARDRPQGAAAPALAALTAMLRMAAVKI